MVARILLILLMCVQPLLWFVVYMLFRQWAADNEAEFGLAVVCMLCAILSIASLFVILYSLDDAK